MAHFSTFMFILLFLSLLFVEIIAIGAGKLGIAFQGDLYIATQKVLYSSVAHFEEDLSTWKESEIAGLAEQAYNDMGTEYLKDQIRYNNVKFRKPKAMSVIVQGNNAYFASSMTGGGAFFYRPVMVGGRETYTPGNINPDMMPQCVQIQEAFTACQASSTSKSGR